MSKTQTVPLFVRLKVLVMTDGRHGVEVYHETPLGCFLMGLVGHTGNFLDTYLEGLWWVLAAGLVDLWEIADQS